MDFKTDGETINSRLQKLAHECPEKSAFIFWDKNLKRTVLTRQDVWDKSRKCAAFFRRHGIVKGDVVCNTLVNSQERLITTYGAMLAGAVSMHGQKLLADGEDIVKNLEDAQSKLVLINPDEEKGLAGVLEKLRYEDFDNGNVQYRGLPNLSKIVPIALDDNDGRRLSWLQLLDKEQEMYVDETVTEDDVGMIMTTSGSTGFAKVVPHTHKALILIGISFGKLIHLNQDSVYFNKNFLGWMGGCPVNYPAMGLTRVLIDTAPGMVEDIGGFITHVLEFDKCDGSLIVAYDVEQILNHLKSIQKHKLSTLLPVISMGGGPVSVKSMTAIGILCECLVVLYGASEFGVVFGLDVTDPSDFENACCGYPLEIAEVKIVDKDLQEVTPGKSGDVLFRGPTLFSGYINNPEADKKSFLADGWWRTSDIGHVNEKGQLFVFCRDSNIISNRGSVIYPGWMESRLDKHPDIKKSFIVGIPEPIVVEEICACITTTPGSNLTEETVREYCNSLFLTGDAGSITPTPNYYLFFESFPYKSNGKYDRKAIKETALRRVQVEKDG